MLLAVPVTFREHRQITFVMLSGFFWQLRGWEVLWVCKENCSVTEIFFKIIFDVCKIWYEIILHFNV